MWKIAKEGLSDHCMWVLFQGRFVLEDEFVKGRLLEG
jgi:hypothetical protein